LSTGPKTAEGKRKNNPRQMFWRGLLIIAVTLKGAADGLSSEKSEYVFWVFLTPKPFRTV
jgi:hypothetical protein